MEREAAKSRITEMLKEDQERAVSSDKRRVLVVAGAGSGKTEIMARRIAWWVAIKGVPKEKIVAITFMEKAAEELKFRVRSWIEKITDEEMSVNLGNMFVGTFHAFCLNQLRNNWPDKYHNYEVLDEAAKDSLIMRGYYNVLNMGAFENTVDGGQNSAIELFKRGYDQLHEHNRFKVDLPDYPPPGNPGGEEQEWCREAELLTPVGDNPENRAFADSAARYYAFLRCRCFLDFSTSQTEFFKMLDSSEASVIDIDDIHLVVDEVQDINPIQKELIDRLVGERGKLTAVGDHRQSIYGFRGSKVKIIGDMWENFKNDGDSDVVEIQENFRSTPRIIDISNDWADTIDEVGRMETPDMEHGKKDRVDNHQSHVALTKFGSHRQEAEWIAQAIRAIVPSREIGAEHDKRDGKKRGLDFSDIAILVRSSTDIRTYMEILESHNIPVAVRKGPHLFSQPEILLIVGAMGITAGLEEYYGAGYSKKTIPGRVSKVLGCEAVPEAICRNAAVNLRRTSLDFEERIEERLITASEAIRDKIFDNRVYSGKEVEEFRSEELKNFLIRKNDLRRVFPQKIYHWLLIEAEIDRWDRSDGRARSAMFHLGTLSELVRDIETPGWTSPGDYKWQIISLTRYGAEKSRLPEQTLMEQPDTVTITTIHSAKGLEFPAIFLADVRARRFPSNMAKRVVEVPLSGEILDEIDITSLWDNQNYDEERRLMYVALTRAERFLITTYSGKHKSCFIKELSGIFVNNGGVVTEDSDELLRNIRHAPVEKELSYELNTTFSELRYFFKCPHDFYLRKVMGFSPTIDQVFGYGRAVHNLMRAVHSDPVYWAEISDDRERLEENLKERADRGLFYLRYTTGEPAKRMRNKGVQVVANYVQRFADELRELEFEPEKEFETVVDVDGMGEAMISGAIDIIRRDDPPRVTLIDFKSGEPDYDRNNLLDREEMALQLGIYSLAAKDELEYEPDKALVRYLDSDRMGPDGEIMSEIEIPLDAQKMAESQNKIKKAIKSIWENRFYLKEDESELDGGERNCKICDFVGFCGMGPAMDYKNDGLS